jgi:hypothetical protein
MELSGQLHDGRFTPRERAPGMYLIGGWMVSRGGLNAVVKRKNPFIALAGESNTGRHHYTD